MKFRKLIEGVEIDSLGNQLTPEQSKYFANSKVRDTKGRLLVCYHGTNTKFSSFEHVKKGMQLGADLGFWFTTNVNVARRFSQVSGDDDTMEFLKWRDAKEDEFVNRASDLLTPYIQGLPEYDKERIIKFAAWRGLDQHLKDKFNLNDIPKDVEDKIESIADEYTTFYHTDTSNLRAEFEKTYAPKSIPTLISAYLNIEKLKILNGGDIGVGWTRFNEISAAEDEGYDGVLIKSGDTGHGIADEYVVFNSNQIKLITNKIPTSSKNLNEKSYNFSNEFESDILNEDATHYTLDSLSFPIFKSKLISLFSTIGDDLPNYLGAPLNDSIDPYSALYILPNGKILSTKEAGIAILGHDGLDSHAHLINLLGWKLLNSLLPSKKDVSNWLMDNCEEYEPLLHELYPELTTKYGWARLNCGNTWVEDRFYCVLPTKMSSSQYSTLLNWLEWGESNDVSEVLIYIGDGTQSKVYSFKEYYSEDILKKIKRFYSSGRFYESKIVNKPVNKKLTESLPGDTEPNVYVDFVNELHSTFNSMSTEQVISFLNINQRNDLDTESPMFILPNGKFVSVQETLDTNGVDVDELTHQSICECFAWCLMSDLKYDTDTVAEIVDQDWRLEREFANLLSELTYKLGWARINCGTKAVDRRFYGVLPNEVSNKQWWSFETWLNWGYDKNKSDVLVFVTDRVIAKKFKMNDFAPVFPEEIVKNIRRFYSSGRFYESVYDKKLTESLQRIASNAFITDSPYQIRDLLVNKPKLYRILYDKNIDMYMIGDGNEVIHWDLIREARKQGYYATMEEFIDELGELDNYVEFGEGGQFLGDEEIESYLIYMVFSPDDEEFMLGEDGYQFRYQLPFGVMFTRDSYLEDCDLYKVVKATANISEGKEMNKLTEGVWSMPDSQEKVDIIRELFKNPIGADEVEEVKDKLYDVLGSDDLFDGLDKEDDEDYRYVIASYIEQLLDNYSDDIDDNLGKQLNDIIQSFDSFYGSKNYMNEGIVHTDEDDNVNGLKLASALKVGDVFYDDYTQHSMKVIAVSPNSAWSVLVAVEDLQTGENKEMRLGVSSIVELAGENDIEVEVDDDIDIEWHPIDDYFDGDI